MASEKSPRIPFDSVVLAAVVDELRPFVGAFVQEVRQPDESTVCLSLYAGKGSGVQGSNKGSRVQGVEGSREGLDGGLPILLLSCHPVFGRVHFVTRKPSNQPEPPAFCAALRARLDGAHLADARQVARDRILELTFDSATKGTHRLIAELMGKHSNLILIESNGRIVSAAKWVGEEQSSRPIRPKGTYEWPPVIESGDLADLAPTGPRGWARFAAKAPKRVSPFFRDLAAAAPLLPETWEPCLVPGSGAYPVSTDPLGLTCHPRQSISSALEVHFSSAVIEHETEVQRASLAAQLERVALARETALADLRQTQKAGEGANKWQRLGELILAYGASLHPSAAVLQAWDYDGTEVLIKLDTELDFKGNAARYFDKAKRAKARAGTVLEQFERLQADLVDVQGTLGKLASAVRLIDVRSLREESAKRRWLTSQPVGKSKEDRPFEGHRIRELMGPSGIRVLFGENAESNDYLTLRVAKPNDLWLHVRGSTSAHVVIVTDNRPERVSPEQLQFAAKIAVQQSKSKHAGYVPVDYTLKKYVRRPRGAPKGTALYTHEKTLHIES